VRRRRCRLPLHLRYCWNANWHLDSACCGACFSPRALPTPCDLPPRFNGLPRLATDAVSPVPRPPLPPTHPPLSPARRCSEGLYHCDYCHKDLSSTLRIKCAVCKDFDLCLECFSVGVTLNVAGHASHHAYKVVQSLGFPLYHPAWRVSRRARGTSL
jgi:hypothetical protein